MACFPVFPELLPELGVDGWQKFQGELLRQLREALRRHFPQEAVEDALHAFRAKQFREGKEGKEKRDGKKPGGLCAEDVVAEQELAVPREECAVHVEEGDAGWRGFRQRHGFRLAAGSRHYT